MAYMDIYYVQFNDIHAIRYYSIGKKNFSGATHPRVFCTVTHELYNRDGTT